MERELIQNMRAVFEAYRAASPLSSSTIWARAAKDARFFTRVEGGATFTVKTYDTVVRWFSDNWPESAVWPEHVERPIREIEPAA